MVDQIEVFETGQIEKILVYGIDLDVARERFGRRQHAPLDVGIQGIVRTADRHTVRFDKIADLENGITHLNAERLGLRRSGDRIAVVVRSHDRRNAAKGQIHDAFCGNIEGITVA